MCELIHQYTHRVRSSGAAYVAMAYGEARDDGKWEGWLQFLKTDDDFEVFRTARETTQPDRAALAYWAAGLGPVYLEGALQRATKIRRQKPGRLELPWL